MTSLERDFLEKYYKASYTSQPEDWFQAALAAKRMYNESRPICEEKAEAEIQIAAALNANAADISH